MSLVFPDLSHHNPSVDFGTLKRAGCRGVALKASEGSGNVDATLADRRSRAHLVGFERIYLYHFCHPDVDPKQQANHFANVVGSLSPGEYVCLDVEQIEGGGVDWPSLEDPAAYVLELVYFLKIALGLKAADVRLYTSMGWAKDVFGDDLVRLSFMPLWLAEWTTTGKPNAHHNLGWWTDYEMVQYTGNGSISGVSGPVDLNEFNPKVLTA